jgi:hypothetical protein
VAIVPAHYLPGDEERHKRTHFPDFNTVCDLMRDDKNIKVHRLTSTILISNIRSYVIAQQLKGDPDLLDKHYLCMTSDINGTELEIADIPHLHVQLGHIPGCTSEQLVFTWHVQRP